MPSRTLRVVTVFFASPGDVSDERSLFGSAIDELNSTTGAELGIRLQVTDWHDVKAGMGRAQGLINPSIEEADVFLGILWSRWGTPTGSYTAGFEEEYELAKSLNRNHGRPEVMLYFKAVDEQHLQDPGPQLTRVVAFKEKAQGDALCKSFDGPEQLCRTTRQDFTKVMFERARPLELPPVSGTPSPVAVSAETTSQAKACIASPASGQLATLLQRTLDSVNKGSMDLVKGAPEVGETDATRLYLASASLAKNRHTLETLSVHDINLAYKHRKEIAPTERERHLLERTLLGTDADVVPGWYWFKDMTEQDVKWQLLSLSLVDGNEAVARAATAKFGFMHLRSDDYNQALTDEMLARPQQVAREYLTYLGRFGTVADVEKIDTAMTKVGDRFPDEAYLAKKLIEARANPAQVLKLAESAKSDIVNKLLAQASATRESIAVEDLNGALTSQHPQVRRFALGEMIRRCELGPEKARQLLTDDSTQVAKAALSYLLTSDAQIEESLISKVFEKEPQGRREALSLWYSRQPADVVRLKASWYNAGWIAYWAMGEHHFDEFARQIRADLSSRFAVWRAEGMARLQAENRGGEAALWDANITKDRLDDYLLQQFAAAAMNALALHGQQSDVEFARTYLPELSYGDAQWAAVRLLAKHGVSTDSAILLRVAQTTFDDSLREFAARAALHLAPGKEGAAAALLGGDNAMLISLALASLVQTDPCEAERRAIELLHKEADSPRIKALAVLVSRLEPQRLEELLDGYATGQYYYNVVCWLDRVLYAPEPIRSAYRNLFLVELPMTDPRS